MTDLMQRTAGWVMGWLLSVERDERGDVPGWVMITVMSAALVGGLYVLVGPRLESMLSNALDTVLN